MVHIDTYRSAIRDSIALTNDNKQLRERIAELEAENAAMLKQWNDLDQRAEKNHREWSRRIVELEAEYDVIQAEVDEVKKNAETTAEFKKLNSRAKRLDEQLRQFNAGRIGDNAGFDDWRLLTDAAQAQKQGACVVRASPNSGSE